MNNIKIGTEVLFFVDESYNPEFCGVCIVCIQGKEGYKIAQGIKTKNLPSRIHYHDDNISNRQSIASSIAIMPISAYVAITKNNFPKEEKNKYELIYKTLLPELLKPLRMKFSKRLGGNVNFLINFENLSDKPKRDVKFFEGVFGMIPSCADMNYTIVTKSSEPLIFLPDYFIGFIRDHLSTKKKIWPASSLKLLSEKIGVLLLYEKGKITRYERGKQISDFLS
jgi:hypothetical protein